MSNVEMPLVLFSVLSQTAIGLVFINSCRQWATDGPSEDNRRQWGIVLAFLVTGMVASFFHLGHPLQAYTALKHLGKAWLSWELLGISIFLCLSIFGMLVAFFSFFVNFTRPEWLWHKQDAFRSSGRPTSA